MKTGKLKYLLASVLLVLGTFCFACTSWERTTYQTLSSANATIQCASAGYNHNDAEIVQYCTGATNPSSLYLPQTRQVHDILDKAGKSKDIAANAMVTYEAAKSAKNSTADQAALQANVNTAVMAVTADVAEIAMLVKTGGK